jgi:hypothetical protein
MSERQHLPAARRPAGTGAWSGATLVAGLLAIIASLALIPTTAQAAPVDVAISAETLGAGTTLPSAGTVRQSGCPCTLWPPSAVPVVASFPDPHPIEVGVKFRSSIRGHVFGVRFYKGADNVGSHLGSLWTADGQRLASAEFVGESPTGWQEVRFSTPVAISENTTYIASYHTDVGFYAVSRPYFTAPVSRGPLTALADGDGGNGVFRYGASAFPNLNYQASNYWVDVVFDTTMDVVPPAIGDIRVTDVDASGATIRWRTDEPADSQVEYGPTPGYGQATPLDRALVTDHAVRISGLAPNTGYHARVRSRDGAGNLGGSPGFTFGTAAPPPPPLPPQACIPRPNVAISVGRDGPGRLRVTVTARSSSTTPNNRLVGIRFWPGSNALVDIGGQVGRSGGFTVALTDRPLETVFFVRQAQAGQATTQQLVVIDDCGEFPSMVGGGVAAFQ